MMIAECRLPNEDGGFGKSIVVVISSEVEKSRGMGGASVSSTPSFCFELI